MQIVKTVVKPRVGIVAGLLMVGLVASVMGLAPTHGAANTLAAECTNPPQTATFNYWPVTYDGANTPFCHDFPAIDAALDTNSPQFSTSDADWNDGLTLNTGDQAAAELYIHNGAANTGIDPTTTMAKNVHVLTDTEQNVGTSHQIKVTYTADNAATFTKSFTIHTPANSKLEVKPNSGYIYDYQAHILKSGIQLGDHTDTALGDMNACFEFSMFLTFKFKVVTVAPSTDTTLSITKNVRNISTNNSDVYTSSVNANRGDQVGYKVVVTNTGNTVAKNVTVTDPGTSGLTIDSGSTRVTTQSGNTEPVWSGSMPGTVNLGDLQPGEIRWITYTARTSDTCTTLVNRATATATGLATISATASVVVDNCGGGGTSRKISISKKVKNNTTGNSYSDSTQAYTNDRVNFKVTVSNTGNATLNNVIMTDAIPSGLQFDDSVTGDGTAHFNNNNTFSMDFGSISTGSSKTVEFAARVTTNSNTTICNVAKANATSVSEVQDDACVTVKNQTSGNPNIVLSKRAFNNTKNVDAVSTSAARGDYITYTLVTTNNGSANSNNYVIQDDLSQVLPLADIVSTNGGTVSGNMISYPAITIHSGETITKTFQVRIKQSLSSTLTYQLTNTYGNTVVINVPGTVIYHAPTTGAAGNSAAAFAGIVTAGFVVARKRNSILKFIFA